MSMLAKLQLPQNTVTKCLPPISDIQNCIFYFDNILLNFEKKFDGGDFVGDGVFKKIQYIYYAISLERWIEKSWHH